MLEEKQIKTHHFPHRLCIGSKIAWMQKFWWCPRHNCSCAAFENDHVTKSRWVTERDRLRRWGAKLFSSFNAQRNRYDFLQDLHPDVISCFQRLVPERRLSSRKTRWIKLTIKAKKTYRKCYKTPLLKKMNWSVLEPHETCFIYDALHELTHKNCIQNRNQEFRKHL